MTISAVVITHNEEENLEQCLSSLDFVDEIIVLDSFSTDRTLEIARKYTDKVSKREFKGFAEQRNAAQELATGEWLLIVDADEVVTPALAAELREAADRGDHDAYRVPRLTYFMDTPIRHCGWYPDYSPRLTRRAKTSFGDRLVHETITVDGTFGTLKSDLLHYSYRSTYDLVRKITTYSRAAAEQKMRDGERFRLSSLIFAPGLAFLKKYIVKQGYRDGLPGFLVCALTQCGVFLRYVMLWEMSRHKEPKK